MCPQKDGVTPMLPQPRRSNESQSYFRHLPVQFSGDRRYRPPHRRNHQTLLWMGYDGVPLRIELFGLERSAPNNQLTPMGTRTSGCLGVVRRNLGRLHRSRDRSSHRANMGQDSLLRLLHRLAFSHGNHEPFHEEVRNRPCQRPRLTHRNHLNSTPEGLQPSEAEFFFLNESLAGNYSK